MLLAAYGGLRAGELFGLRAKRVDPLRRTVTIAETVVDVGGHPYFGAAQDPGRPPHRPAPPRRRRPLGEHLRTYGRQPDDLVFTAPEGGPVQLNVWRQRFWAPAVRDAGLAHLRPHDLRHTVVALWMAAGANLKEVAARAGHTSVSFTLDRYGHLLPGSEQRLNDALDALAKGAQTTAEVMRDTDDASDAREETISFAHVARTPEDRDESVSDVQAR